MGKDDDWDWAQRAGWEDESGVSGGGGDGGGSGDGNVPTKSGEVEDLELVIDARGVSDNGGGVEDMGTGADGDFNDIVFGVDRNAPDRTQAMEWMPTITSAVKVITAALLLVTVAAGADIYQTYNDAIAIDLEKHITDADFELSEDKSEISGSVGFDIPEMGMFEKSIIASVHITVLESNPTTEGDYEFEYTLGSGEQFYEFTLDDLDPVTVEKIEAEQPLDIEYSGTISVTYLGIEIPSITMDIPLTTTIVETA